MIKKIFEFGANWMFNQFMKFKVCRQWKMLKAQVKWKIFYEPLRRI